MIRRPKDVSRQRSRKAKEIKIEVGVDLIAARHVRPGPDGLEAFFPGGKGRHASKPISLAFLSCFDAVTARALADGWAVWVAKQSRSSRLSCHDNLKRGFVRWLTDVWLGDTGRQIPHISAFDETLIRAYIDYVNEEDSAGYLARRTDRQHRVNCIQRPLSRLQLSDTWAGRLSPDLNLSRHPFGRAERQRQETNRRPKKPKNIIGRTSYESLWAEATRRIELDIAAYAASLDELEAIGPVGKGKSPFTVDEAAARSPAALAHWLMCEHGWTVPTYDRAIHTRGYRPFVTCAQHEAAERLIYPELADVIPFLFLTIAFFALNTEVAFGLTLEEVRVDAVPGGGRMLKISPGKPRADSRQRGAVAETDDIDNPARFLPHLERRTRYLREAAPDGVTRNVFLYFSKRRTMPIEKTTWYLKEALDELAASARVQPFAFRNLRLTTLDVIHEITNGDIVAVSTVAGHKSLRTTHVDYRTEGMRRRYEEKHGAALEEWERFWGSDGRIDVSKLPPALDRTAATPGYGCKDPKDSPVPGEKPDRLCRAYGECPTCEHVIIYDRSPHSYRCLQQLLERIEEAEQVLSGPAYLARWSEKKIVLVTDHLERFDPATRLAAADVVVPRLPSLD